MFFLFTTIKNIDDGVFKTYYLDLRINYPTIHDKKWWYSYRIESCKIFFQILNSFFANNPCDYRDLLFLYYFQLCITNDQMTRCERAQARNDRETQARVVEMVEKLGSRGTQMTHLHEVSLLFRDISLSRHLLRSMPFTDSPSTFPFPLPIFDISFYVYSF